MYFQIFDIQNCGIYTILFSKLIAKFELSITVGSLKSTSLKKGSQGGVHKKGWQKVAYGAVIEIHIWMGWQNNCWGIY